MLAAAAVAALAGCGGDSDAAGTVGQPAAGRSEPTETLVRIPTDGGEPSLYRAASLEPIAWAEAPRLPAIGSVVGTVGDDQMIYLLDRGRGLLGLDLETGRLREIVGGITAAAAAPDGGVVAVDTGGTAIRIRRRTPQPLRGSLAGTARALYPTQRGGVVAPLEGVAGGVAALGADHPPARLPFPAGPTAATTWGELVAAGTDSGLVLYDPSADDSLSFIETRRRVHAVAFSPSGHRIYVASPDAELIVLDRYGEGVLQRVELPGPAGALRVDRYGRWLLARPVTGDSLWAVDLVAGRLAGSARGSWSDDLPRVAGDRLLVRQGAAVAVLDLGASGLPPRGTVAGGGADRWTVLQWAPPGGGAPSGAEEPTAAQGPDRDPDAAEEPDLDADADEPDGGGAPVYLQVSSSRNPDWANDLVRQMQAAGLPASLLDPTAEGEPYRVVLGPYATRADADEAGRRLGRAYFIIGGGRDSAATSADAP